MAELRDQYLQFLFGDPNDRSFNSAEIDDDRIREALTIAHDIRKFEIELYWRRALYFWGFNIAIFAGIGVLMEPDCCGDGPLSQITAIGLSLLGLFISIAWFFMSRGAKAWQENWEQHVLFLEDHVTGGLLKTWLGNQTRFFSVTRINQSVIFVIGGFWFLLAEMLIATMIWPEWALVVWSLPAPSSLAFLLPALVAGTTLWWAYAKWRTDFDAGWPAPLHMHRAALRSLRVELQPDNGPQDSKGG